MEAAQNAPVLVEKAAETVTFAPVLGGQRSKEWLRLKKRHRLFVDAYLASFDQTVAARAIGCTPGSAKTAGGRLCRQAYIISAIDAELAIKAEANGITASFVLNNIKDIATSDKARNA